MNEDLLKAMESGNVCVVCDGYTLPLKEKVNGKSASQCVVCKDITLSNNTH